MQEVFAAPVTLPIGGTPAYLRLGNLDAGDQLDLVVSNSSATTVAVLLNLGSLAFSITHYVAETHPRGSRSVTSITTEYLTSPWPPQERPAPSSQLSLAGVTARSRRASSIL